MTQSTADHQDLSNGKDTSTSAIKDRASKTLEKGVETARETTAQAVDQAKIASEQVTEEIGKLTESGSRFVRENPGLAVAGAIGVGVLIGLMVRNRD